MSDNSGKGGKFRGNSHAKGGIDFTVKGSGKKIEVEGDEPLISSEALRDSAIREYTGTNLQILNYINKSTS